MRPQLHAQSNEVWKVNSFMITLYVNYSVKVFFLLHQHFWKEFFFK